MKTILRRTCVILLALALALVLCPARAAAAESASGFPDVEEGEWYEESLLRLCVYTPGIITGISAVANASAGADSGVTYTVYVDFTPDDNTRYGMSAVVTTLDTEETEEVSEDAQAD